MLNLSKLLSAYAKDEFQLDFLDVTLQQSCSSPLIFKGRGALTLLKDEGFQLKLYAERAGRELRYVRKLINVENLAPGDIIPDEYFFEMQATDVSGHAWSCRRVWLVDNKESELGALVKAEMASVTYRGKTLGNTQNSWIKLYFFQELTLPYFEVTKKEVRRPNGDLSESSLKRDHQNLKAEGLDIQIQRCPADKGSTLIQAVSNNSELPAHLATSLQEAISYVACLQLKAFIIERAEKDQHEVVIYPRDDSRQTFFYPPVPPSLGLANDYWNLFQAYFQFVMRLQRGDELHPLSEQLRRIYIDSTNLTAICLLLSVTVEGVLDSEVFETIGRPQRETLENIDCLLGYIEKMPEINSTVLARARGAIGNMKFARAKDKLLYLKECGVVSAEMVTAWEKLRNSSAHASLHEDVKKLNVSMNQCFKVYALLNRLIFVIIGFAGRHTDFSIKGWPTESFHARL